MTEAFHLGEEEIPWVDTGTGVELKLVQADIEAGLWIVRNRFAAGVVVQKHKHTGQVYGYTLTGSWKYAEYGYVNRAGSFLYEPAGSEHTLSVLDDNTELTDVWFQIYGSNLNLDAEGNVESITDAEGIYAAYMAMCEAQGLGRPNVLT
ncbi:MAG: 2,4'-dihydroxyacetophenone dioxygenase family protein [Acidimicrobiaceae bacterium]|nr:2,4'-dihydroxyacetophenone dioxygenase family protein [Acidimicrobiaceae bacterium]MDE0607092.1 2,4'-dihydroxyacetophenone dioxygenase family protein [Acidimicrobiaceae bacterium]